MYIYIYVCVCVYIYMYIYTRIKKIDINKFNSGARTYDLTVSLSIL